MARRGRFTSPNSGGQNLTALIVSLLRERKNAEEQALLDAYRTGSQYNGAVPTAADIQAFYDDWASAAGYAPGTLEYQAIFQKKADLNNYDLKKQFNALISTFNTTDGSNYQDIINFLGNEAQTSTDPNDIADYANSVETTTSAYLKYQGQRLVRGELTASEYQNLTLEALKVLDPGSTAYKNAIYDAFQYEWNAEATKWQNRIKAGTATSGQFRSWSNSFRNRLIQSGISKDSDLYTSIGASIAQTSIAVGDSPVNTRLNATLGTLNDVFSLAQAQIGGVEVGIGDIMGDPKDVLKKLRDNPDLMGLYADWIDQNRSSIGPLLSGLGITDGASFRQWFEDTLKGGLTDAQAITAAGGNANWDDWTAAATTNGALTTFDEFATVASKHARDVANANGNDSLINFYDNEYRKFLAGEKSQYGTAPVGGLYEQQLAVLQNEVNAMNGRYQDGTRTLTGALNGEELTWGNIALTVENATALQTGQAVMVWDKATGTYTTENRRSVGYKQGSYQYVSFTVLPDGTKVPHVVSVTGKEIVDSDGNENGYVYELPNGKTYAVDAGGNAYEVTSAVPVAREGYSIEDFSKFGTKMDSIPLIDTTPLIRQGVNLGAFNPNDPEARRAALTQFGVDAADLEAAAQLALQVAGGLDEGAQSQIEAESQKLIGQAVDIRAGQLEATATTADDLANAAAIRNKPEAAQYNTYVKPNMDKYEEVAKGLFRLKDTSARANAQEQNKYLAMGGQLTGNRFDVNDASNLPMVVDLRPDWVKNSDRERDVNYAERIFAGYGVQSTQAPSDGFFRNMPTTKKQQYGVLPPALPPAALAPSVVVPPTPPVHKPDIIEPTAPTMPVAPPPPPVLPPSRGGGVRKL